MKPNPTPRWVFNRHNAADVEDARNRERRSLATLNGERDYADRVRASRGDGALDENTRRILEGAIADHAACAARLEALGVSP